MPVLGHEFARRDSTLTITVYSPDKSNVMGLREKDNVLRDSAVQMICIFWVVLDRLTQDKTSKQNKPENTLYTIGNFPGFIPVSETRNSFQACVLGKLC